MSWLVAALAAMAVLAWPPRSSARRFVARTPRELREQVPGDSGPAARATGGRTEEVSPGQVATAVDLLALALGGGAGVAESIEVVAAEIGGPVGRQLQVVAAGLRWGLSDPRAWGQLPVVWAPAARAMTLAGLAGVPAATLLRAAAADLRRAEQTRLEVAAARLGVSLVLPLGLAFLPAFVLTTVVPVVLALAQQILGGAPT